MEKELTWFVAFDLGTLVNMWNKFLKGLGHYKIIKMKFFYIDNKYNVLIVHQKIGFNAEVIK